MLPSGFEPEAAEELERAQEWYEERVPGLGGEFVRAVKAVVAQAAREPEFYPVVHRDIRRGTVRRFPYGVLYGIREGQRGLRRLPLEPRSGRLA